MRKMTTTGVPPPAGADRVMTSARAALLAIKAVSREALHDLRAILDLLRQDPEVDPRVPAAGLARLPDLMESLTHCATGPGPLAGGCDRLVHPRGGGPP